jgi:membrane-associated protease RseP (regulator of RpoE activity)
VFNLFGSKKFLRSPIQENPARPIPVYVDWRSVPSGDFYYTPVPARPRLRTLLLAGFLFLLTLCTCLVAGTHFALAFANHQAVSWKIFEDSFKLLYLHPASLLAGLPFALTLMTILLAHELGHFFACRYHRIRTSYPFFIPFPSLIGTFGAFILIRSPIRTTRALFDVGASGPFVGFVFAIPALVYGIVHAQVVPGLADPNKADAVFGVPLILQLFSAVIHPGVAPQNLLLHPIGRAAWVGLFATSLNLLPAGQLDGGHILRSVNSRLHYTSSLILPVFLAALGFLGHWQGWYFWAAMLFIIRFFRVPAVYDPAPLDPTRRLGAFLALLIFLLTFMVSPL